MICVHHSRDLDGYCSAAIIKKKYPEIKLIGFDYGQEFPLSDVGIGEEVIMVDVSLPMIEMQALGERTQHNFTWIDHHISAINEYNEFVESEGGVSFCTHVLQDGIAACEIAWNYCFPNSAMPKSVELLGKYDTWRNGDKIEWDNKIMPFQYGMRARCNSAETFPMTILIPDHEINELIQRIIEEGSAVLKYTDMTNEKMCGMAAFETEFEGLRAICLNNGQFNSGVFESVYDESKHDIMIPFQYNGKGKFWTVSLYTTKDEVDCSVFAKKRGGGGHKKAAGFQVENMDFLMPKS